MATLATRENATRQVPRLPSSQRRDAAVRSLCSRSRSVVSVARRLLAATRSLTRAIHLVLDATSPPKWRIGSTDALPSGPIPHSGLRPGAPHKAKFACASVQDQGFETPPSDPSRRSCTTDGCLRSILESCALSPPCASLCSLFPPPLHLRGFLFDRFSYTTFPKTFPKISVPEILLQQHQRLERARGSPGRGG